MKRLWVLLCVICIAPPAEASLLISANGAIDVPFAEVKLQPDETAVIGIHGDGLTPPNIAAWLLVEGPGLIDGYTMIYRGSLAACQDFPGDWWEPIPTPEEILAMLREFSGRPNLMDLSSITLADGVIPPAPLDGLLVDNIIFRCDGLGDITLTLLSDDFTILYDTQDIQQIPEPMTLLLLGLGGLILARKARRCV